MTLSVLDVALALTCVESALYGIFFVLAVTSLGVLVVRHGKDTGGRKPSLFSFPGVLRSPLFIATVMLLLTVSAHWVITVRRVFFAFIYHEHGREPATFYSFIEAPTQVTATAFVISSVIVGDIILTYRIWVVWDRKLAMIIFPTLCTMAYAASGISVVQLFATFTPGESVFVSESQGRIIPTATLTLSTNIYGTVSIAYRIWSTNRTLKNERMMVPGMSVLEALVIFVESAALYTSWTLFFLLAYAAHSILYSFALHCIPAATGISFMLIIVRVGLGFSSWTETPVGVLPPTRRGAPPRQDAHDPAGYPLRMITLNVTRTVDRETDFALPQISHGEKRRSGSGLDVDSDIAKHSTEDV